MVTYSLIAYLTINAGNPFVRIGALKSRISSHRSVLYSVDKLFSMQSNGVTQFAEPLTNPRVQ